MTDSRPYPGVREHVGRVSASGKRVEISDDPRRVIADVLRLALDAPERTAAVLMAALTPGGDEYGSPGGDSIVLMEEPEDIPVQFQRHIGGSDLAARELWLVSRYTPGQGYDEAVIEGKALRELVERFAQVLDALDLRRGERSRRQTD